MTKEQEIYKRLVNVIVEQLEVEEDEIAPDTTFIEDLGMDSLDAVELIMAAEEEFGIEIRDEDAESFKSVADVLKFICWQENYWMEGATYKEINVDNNYQNKQSVKVNLDNAGLAAGNARTVNMLYEQERFNAAQGHGFAAERANDLYDNRPIFGKGSRIVGDNNAQNGADRIAGGLKIQSKYCQNGQACIRECFDGNGNFRYINRQGRPMLIEVPADEEIYNAAVEEMKKKISQGKVPGVSDPKEATRIVRRGNVTYEQAKNIAKAGNVDSLYYDAKNGAVTAGCAFGITVALRFAVGLWNDENFDDVLEDAVCSGLKVGGLSWVTSIASSQLARTGLSTAMVGSTEAIAQFMGSKASAALVNAFREGGSIYGAAATRSAAKLLRGNAITGLATVAVLSIGDAANLFEGRISFAQMFKNVAQTGAGVAGGMGGFAAGAAIGSAILPVGGTLIGGLLGGFLGGSAAGSAAKCVLDGLIEDDAKEMLDIINKEFSQLAVDYLINKAEGEKICDSLKEKITADTLKNMYASSDRNAYAYEMLAPIFDKVAESRRYVCLPSEEELENKAVEVLEQIGDETY